MPGLQAVAEVITTARDTYHVIEALGFTGVMSVGWKLVRVFNDTKLATSEQFGEVRGDIKALAATVEGHMGNTPTLTDCAEKTAGIHTAIASEARNLREEVAVLMLEHGHDVRVLEKRVTALAVKEGIRTGRNGLTS